MSICNACPHKKGANCGVCGCFLALKTRALSDECPKGFWNAVITDEEDEKLDELLKNKDDEN